MGELRCWNHLRAGTGQLRRNALEDDASRRHPREREFAIPGRIFQCVQSSAVQQSSEQSGERELRTDYEQLGEPTSDPTRVEIHLLAGAYIPLLAKEGWRDSLIEAGAPGAKREPDRAKPQLVVSSAKRCAGLTTPSAPSLRSAQPPRLCEEGNAKLFSLWNT